MLPIVNVDFFSSSASLNVFMSCIFFCFFCGFLFFFFLFYILFFFCRRYYSNYFSLSRFGVSFEKHSEHTQLLSTYTSLRQVCIPLLLRLKLIDCNHKQTRNRSEKLIYINHTVVLFLTISPICLNIHWYSMRQSY